MKTLHPFLADGRISGIIQYIYKIVCLIFNGPTHGALYNRPDYLEELVLQAEDVQIDSVFIGWITLLAGILLLYL
jgi:hypothetical protein